MYNLSNTHHILCPGSLAVATPVHNFKNLQPDIKPSSVYKRTLNIIP